MSIRNTSSPNCITVKVKKREYKALVDTGAEVSIISSRVYDQLYPRPELKKKRMRLQAANGTLMRIKGETSLNFKVGSQKVRQDCVVIKELNRLIILGRDWLRSYGVRVYFDLGAIRLNNELIALEEDIHITSVARLAESITLKPQHIHSCTLIPSRKEKEGQILELEQLETGKISRLTGVALVNAVVKINKHRRLQVGIMNNTNQTVTLKKGWRIAKMAKIEEISEISPANRSKSMIDIRELEKIQIPSQFKEQAMRLLKWNRDRFASEDRQLGKTNTIKMRIDTGDHPPIKKRPYPTPLAQRKKVEEAIEQMLEDGIVERSQSPWGFPIVLVKKKDNSLRFCVDYRELNKITTKSAFPLPVIEHTIATLGRAKYFSTLDLKSGYWQVALDEKDKEKTAFTCHYGLFSFNCLPFGLSNGPAVFQELMSIVLQGQERHALAYLDDVLVFSETKEQHLEHLQQVLNALRRHNLKLKPAKCKLFQEETQYLGFRIGQKGVQADPDKISAIWTVPAPKTVRQVRGFIGMCSYYRRFIPDFSSIAEPLINLTRKRTRFKWDDSCEKSFESLKQKLAEKVTLVYPDPNKAYKLYTDASDHAIGACLTQESWDEKEKCAVEKPVHFLSHKLSDTQTRWSTIEKEAYAIHYALHKLHHYLYSASFDVYTDHKPLEYLLKSTIQNRKVQVWALKIAGYNCRIIHLPGKENVVADLLSRAKAETTGEDMGACTVDDRTYQINVINSNRFDPKEFAEYKLPQTPDEPGPARPSIGNHDMIMEQEADTEIMRLRKRIYNGQASKSEGSKFMIDAGVLYYISNPEDEPTVRLYVPKHLQRQVLQQFHDQNGHMGREKTFQTIKKRYYWPGLFKDVAETVSKCIPCQSMNLQKVPPRMQESDMAPFPFAKVALDVTGPYPKTHSGNQYIVTFIDMYSGWPEAFAVADKKAETVVGLLMDEIIPRFGAPLQLLTDNGPENINRVMKRTLSHLNIHHVTTSYYHPQSNGKVERLHRTMNNILAKKIGDDNQSWDLYLNQMLAAIRVSNNETTKFSPFYLLYSREAVLPVDNILQPRNIYYGNQFHEMAIEAQHKAFVRMRRNVRKKKLERMEKSKERTRDIQYQVGDQVYLKNDHRKNKLDQRWKPFYTVIERTGPVSYRVRDQLTGQVSKAHAERLREAKINQWNIPERDRPMRKVTLAAPPPSNSSEREEEMSEIKSDIESEEKNESYSITEEEEEKSNGTKFRWERPRSRYESSDNPAIRRCRHQRESSGDEKPLPLLQRKMAKQEWWWDSEDSTDNSELGNGREFRTYGTSQDPSSMENTESHNQEAKWNTPASRRNILWTSGDQSGTMENGLLSDTDGNEIMGITCKRRKGRKKNRKENILGEEKRSHKGEEHGSLWEYIWEFFL